MKNLGLVADLTLELQEGYNVITGETGAGKSMLIGALGLVLGERADRGLIRAGTETCAVEAVFEPRSLKGQLNNFLEEKGLEPCENGELVLKRTLTSNGTNRQFINGSPASLAILAELGRVLVDIHGPHEHQSLLHPSEQLAILEAYGKLEPLRAAFADVAKRRIELESRKASLIVDERTYAQQLDLLRYQVNEIQAAQLQPNEDQELEAQYKRASNAARLVELCHTAGGVLSENEVSILNQAGSLGRIFLELQRLDPGTARLAELHEQSVSAMAELKQQLDAYIDKLEVDPSRLQALEERMNLLQGLKRKYGPSLPDVITFGASAAEKLQQLERRDEVVAELNRNLEQNRAELITKGRKLSEERKKIIPKLCKAVARQLADLGFAQSRFEVELRTLNESELIETQRVPQSGFDTVEFQFAPNRGEPSHPLRHIASSGELARVMLALKTVLATEDRVPVLIFDEVDANIGGETANAVGQKMLQIGRNHQVLCITHLPQVAAAARAHYVAHKRLIDGRTISEIKLLANTERITELARMLGGQGEATRNHAEALLKTAARP